MSGWVAGAVIVGGTLAAGAQVYASGQASDAAANATAANSQSAANATQLQQMEFNTNQANMQPWLTAGTGAINQLNTGMRQGGQFAQAPPAFQFDQSKVATDPGYAWRTQQGNNAITAAGAASGNLGSGNLGVALQNYGQNAASQEYGQAYQRAYGSQLDAYNSQQQAQSTLFNRLSSVAGTGQTAGNQLGAAGQNMANNVGNIGMQNAQLNGQIGMNNANNQIGIVQGGVQSLINGYGAYNQNQLYQNYLQNQQGLTASNQLGGNASQYTQVGGNMYWGDGTYAGPASYGNP